MQPHLWCAFFLLVGILVVGAWDVYALFFLPPGATVSAVVQDWSHRYPILPAIVGLVVGHIFWPVNRP